MAKKTTGSKATPAKAKVPAKPKAKITPKAPAKKQLPEPLPKRTTSPVKIDSASTHGFGGESIRWDKVGGRLPNGKYEQGERTHYDGKYLNHLGKYNPNETLAEREKGARGSRVADPKTGLMGTRQSKHTDRIVSYPNIKRKPNDEINWDKKVKPEIAKRIKEDKADKEYTKRTLSKAANLPTKNKKK